MCISAIIAPDSFTDVPVLKDSSAVAVFTLTLVWKIHPPHLIVRSLTLLGNYYRLYVEMGEAWMVSSVTSPEFYKEN